MKIVIAGDHYAVELMNEVEKYLADAGLEFENLGTMDEKNEITLQEIIPAVSRKVQSGDANFGILACGTGVGVEIGANRFNGVRASLCRDAEQAKNARVYDDANVLCLGSWYKDDFKGILDAWIGNEFDNDEDRTQMLKDFDRLNRF